jgi:hypothetical protein
MGDGRACVFVLANKLATLDVVVIISNMKAEQLLKDRLIETETRFAELVVWRLPGPLPGSAHAFKYRLVYVVEGICVLRYDNETGKGDHKHIGGIERSYRFVSPQQLLADFWHDVDTWRTEHG